jgi:hypothetical protein
MDHLEPKTEIQVQQVQGVFEGSQVLSSEDTNLAWTKVSPGASNHLPNVLVYHYILIIILACALGHMS